MKRFLGMLLICVLIMGLFSTDIIGAAQPTTFNLGVLLPFTGTFAAVAKTQEQGILLAVEKKNNEDGLKMPWGRVKIKTMVLDDETDINVGVRRFRYLKDQGAHAVVGQTWAAVALAINEICKREPFPYFPVNVAPLDSFKKGGMAESTFATGYTPWTVGYMAAAAAINDLGKKRIYFLGRSDAWGWDIQSGVEEAVKEYGGTIIGRDEVALGTSDFTTVLEKVKAAKPDVFISAQFAGDAIALLKQCYDMGLNKQMTIFNSFITNVVAEGLPAEAREGIYGMHYFYYDLTGFKDHETVKLASEYSKRFMEKWGTPPDAYATIAYIAVEQLFDAVERAKSFEPKEITKAINSKPEFMSVKGSAKWREDHQPVYKYAGFLVRGKGPKEQKSKWDFFEVVSVQGGEKVFPPLKSLGF